MESKISMQEENPELEERGSKKKKMMMMDLHLDFSALLLHSYTKQKYEVDEEEDEGLPPGFHSTAPKPSPALHSSDEDSKQQDVEDDNDGPPPGWEFFSMANALPKPPSNSADANVESNAEVNESESESESDGDDGGPPPGWEKFCIIKCLHHVPHHCSHHKLFLQKLGVKKKKDVDKRPTSVPAASPKHYVHAEDAKNMDKRLLQSNMSLLLRIHRHQIWGHLLLAQLVCGTCRKLLLYPRGAKWVQCPGCQEVNFIQEANEVGQVKCGSCAVLLMYPFGAPAVQCTSCSFVTEIGTNNRRPPLSLQMAQRRRRPNQDESSNYVPFKFVFQAAP